MPPQDNVTPASPRTTGALVPAPQLRPPATIEEARRQSAAISRALRRVSARARKPVSIVSGGATLYSSRSDRMFRRVFVASFIVMVAIPFFAFTAYWGWYAAPQFESSAKFSLRSNELSALDALGSMLGGMFSHQGQNTQVIVDYIRSRSMVDALESTIGLRRRYTTGGDYFSRLEPDATIDELEIYWRKRIDIKIEAASGIVDFSVRAFTPQDAQAISAQVLSLSEALVNDLSTRSRRDALAQTEAELARSKQRLQNAVATMRDARNAVGTLDARGEAAALNSVISALQIQLARVEQEIASLVGVRRDAPQVRTMYARRDSLIQQIKKYYEMIGAPKREGATLADSAAELARHQTVLEIARQIYTTAAIAYDKARSDLETQQVYLAPFIRPELAEQALYPRRIWEWCKYFSPFLLIWSLAASVTMIIRDNRAK